MSTVYSDQFPPLNRLREALPLLRIEIQAAEETMVTDPKGIAVLAHTALEKILALTTIPGRISDISGKPAVLYRTDDIELALSPQELHLLVTHDLTPDQYTSLRSRYGVFHEVSGDFYDEGSGEALQPQT